MCLLISKNVGVHIPKEYLRNGFRENPHGAGFAFVKDGKIIVRKGFMSFKDFWRTYRDFQDYAGIAHFRYGNVGEHSVDNCHPFIVDSNMVFAHNGTISIASSDKVNHAKWSDTRIFNELILKELRAKNIDFLSSPSWRWMISKSIGHSKLVFLDNTGKLDIINKHMGIEDPATGIWYSNEDYKTFQFGFQRKAKKRKKKKNRPVGFAVI